LAQAVLNHNDPLHLPAVFVMAVARAFCCAIAVAVPTVAASSQAERRCASSDNCDASTAERRCASSDKCDASDRDDTLARDAVLLQSLQVLHKYEKQQTEQNTITVMSYNTEYKDYNGRMGGYARKIAEVRPAIVGLQECQNRDGLARLANYAANLKTGKQNYMLYNPSMVTLLDGGWLRIPRDNYADRAITWGKYRLGASEIFFFNTHLPHNHGEAASQQTHARIARMFFRLRRQLGAEDKPCIVVGDMNSFASNWNHVAGGGFESNLEANGFKNAYTARGHPGYSGLDHIMYSEAHWRVTHCHDAGTGGSDHSSITCDMTLK